MVLLTEDSSIAINPLLKNLIDWNNMARTVTQQAKRHIKLTRSLQLSAARKGLIILAILGITMYTVLFTTSPAVHDYFHELRHGLMIIPCH